MLYCASVFSWCVFRRMADPNEDREKPSAAPAAAKTEGFRMCLSNVVPVLTVSLCVGAALSDSRSRPPKQLRHHGDRATNRLRRSFLATHTVISRHHCLS